MKLQVLYEDNHVIAVFKPAGILSQRDKTGDVSIGDQVKRYLKEKYKKPGSVFLGLLHRLDRPVSGIMLFAKTSKGAFRLSLQFRNREVDKVYHAVVVGKPKVHKGILLGKLGKLKVQNSKFKATTQDSKLKNAKLYYEVVQSNEEYSLLKIKLETGRFHQIRAQLALAGLPVLGDVKYGAPRALPDGSIALCATNLRFYCATNPKQIALSVAIPKEWEKIIHR